MGLYEVIKDRLGAEIPTHEKELNEIRDIYFLGKRDDSDDKRELSFIAIEGLLLKNKEIAEYKRFSSVIEILARESIEHRETSGQKKYLLLAEHFATGGAIGIGRPGNDQQLDTVPFNERWGPGEPIAIETFFADSFDRYHVQRALAIFHYAKAVYAWDEGNEERYKEELAKAKGFADKAFKANDEDLQIVTYKILASKEGVPIVDMPFPQGKEKKEKLPGIDDRLIERLAERESSGYSEGKSRRDIFDPLAYEIFGKLADFSPDLYPSFDLDGLIERNPKCIYRARQAMNAYFEEVMKEIHNPKKNLSDIVKQRTKFYEFVQDLLNRGDCSRKVLSDVFQNMCKLYFELTSFEDGSRSYYGTIEALQIVGKIITPTVRRFEITYADFYRANHEEQFLEILLNEGEYSKLLTKYKDRLNKGLIRRVQLAANAEFTRIEAMHRILSVSLPNYILAKEEQKISYENLCGLRSDQKEKIQIRKRILKKYNQFINSNIKQLSKDIGLLETALEKEKLPGSKSKQKRDLLDLTKLIKTLIRPFKEETVHFNARTSGRGCESPLDVYLPTLQAEARQLMHEFRLIHERLLPEITPDEKIALNGYHGIHKNIMAMLNKIDGKDPKHSPEMFGIPKERHENLILSMGKLVRWSTLPDSFDWEKIMASFRVIFANRISKWKESFES